MATELIINATLPETRIALLENNEIAELHIERDSERGIVGNIYKGKVIRVLPGMQAAFVDIGLEKAAFLYVDDIYFPDMKSPLATNPLPEPQPKAQGQGAPSGPQAGKEGGRGGRGRRFGRNGQAPEQQKTAVELPPPGTPEAHAMAQQEYARQMLETEGGVVGGEAPVEGEPLPAEETVSAPVAAAADPAQSVISAEQPEARAPIIEEEDEDDETGTPVVYRPEPLIDTEAWAEELQPVVAAEAPAEAGEGTAPEAAVADVPVEAQAAEAAPAQAEVAPAGQIEDLPKASEALEAKVTPVGPVGVDDEDEDEESEMPRRRRRREPVNISDLVKEGQEILVQVAKDPIGTKGARLTCHVSLPGRYLVFMPTVDHIGVSRRIESESERRRLKETMGKIRPAKTGVIVRTASGKQTDKKLKADLDYLVTTWNDIQKKFNKQRTPSVVYQDLTIVLRAIRDMFTDEVDKVVVDSKREHKAIMKFVTRFIPSVKDKVELYQADMPIFDYYGIETEISRALERKVWLKSGGYLVVDQAEALVAIDVNTGRYVGKKTLEETILKTNLEAVKEIAYQLRLRNCGGIIILDLIDMEKEANREKVYKALEEALKKDRARPSILKISQLGLIEMTRKRTRDSMVRSLCEPCSYCEGKGFVKNKLTIAYDIMRDIEREGVVRDTNGISIQCHPSVADVLLEDKRDVIENMEHSYNKKITIRGNGAYHVEQYELIAHRESKNLVWSSEERRQQLKSRIQERMQAMQAETRKVAEAERQERRREQEERRKQQEAQRQERRAQAEERRRQAAAERAAQLAAQGIDPNSPEYQASLQQQDASADDLEGDLDSFDENEPMLGPDGQPLPPEEVEKLRAARAAQVGDRQGGREGGRRRRRRGRRGRGGRGRREGQQQMQQGQGGQPQQGQGQNQERGQGRDQQRNRPPRRSQQPAGGERPLQVNAVEGVGPGGDTYPVASVSAEQNLGPEDLAGSATGGHEGGEAGGAPGEGRGPRPEGGRRRRRGRRGGRRRRRFGGPRPAGAEGSGGGSGMSPHPAGHSRHAGDGGGSGGGGGGEPGGGPAE